jgi:putative transposase
MARIARVVVPGIPHHIVQRGNRRQQVFFSEQDRITYLDYLRIYAKPAGLHFWAYCLMDNHVHLVVVPDSQESLACGLAETHRRYTRMINFREGWRGYLWAGRFKSYPLSESHLYATIRYVERNPVRVGMVKHAWEYHWSSARAHVFKEPDSLLEDSFLQAEFSDWRSFLSEDDTAKAYLFRAHAATGRPMGDKAFIDKLEELTGRRLKKQKPGPKVEFR